MYPLIRPLSSQDLDDVVRIEQSCYPFPWTLGIFRECLRAGYACHGLQLGEDLAGYSISNWAIGESHLLNLCIDSRWQKRGYGKSMLEHSIQHAISMDCHVMFLEVRPSNVDATQLYLKKGFEEVGSRPAYYQAESGREDALIMRLNLVGETSPAGS